MILNEERAIVTEIPGTTRDTIEEAVSIRDIPVYLDESLKRFKTVFPAVGSPSSAIELDLDELYKYSNALEWIDVCTVPELN